MKLMKSLSLLLFTMFIKFFHLTDQKNTLSVSLPLTFTTSASLQKNTAVYNYKSAINHSVVLMVSLPVGTPSQTQQMVLDTGSQLTWIKCRRNTTETNGTESFDPALSSTFSVVPCNNSVCPISDMTIGTRCVDHLCLYSYFFADETVASGSLIRESFTFPSSQITPPLIIGCSKKKDSSGADGILGMNLGNLSFISQVGVSKFSYCVPAPLYKNDNGDDGSNNNNANNPTGMFYLGDNPNSDTFRYIKLLNSFQDEHKPNFDPLAYTVGLVAIKINGTKLNISEEVFRADTGGYGQTIIDSGTPYTFLVEAAYSEVRQLVVELAGSKLKKDYIYKEMLDMCFHGNPNEIGKMIGDMVFEFDNGADIFIPKNRTLEDVGGNVSCFTIGQSELLRITSNMIGNFHQQNRWMEFDIDNRRIGFGVTKCM
ncbi:hypothetical protein OROHE_012296 [Orobanche hederae]